MNTGGLFCGAYNGKRWSNSNQWHLQTSALWFKVTVMKTHNNICCLAWDDKKMQKMKPHVKLLLHQHSPAVFFKVFIENVVLWLIAQRDILNYKQVFTDKADYNVFSAVTHCGSCRLANKSPLNPSSLGAASHRLHLCKMPTNNLRAWSSPPTELFPPSSFNRAALPPNPSPPRLLAPVRNS